MELHNIYPPTSVTIIKMALNALSILRADRIAPRALRGEGVIFTGHSIRPAATHPFQPNKGLEYSPEFLEQTLAYLVREGIPVITVHEALARLRNGRGPFACFTFDDGYRNNYEVAFPIFRRFNAPFTVFLTSGFLNRTATMWWEFIETLIRENPSIVLQRHDGDLYLPTESLALKHRAFRILHDIFIAAPAGRREAMLAQLARRYDPALVERTRDLAMNWEMAAELAASGLVELGCHTISHPMLSRLSPVELEHELTASASEIECRLGQAPSLCAYPFGSPAAVNGHVVAMAERLGFAAAFTTRKQVLTAAALSNRFALPRISLNGHYQELRYLSLFMSGIPFLRDRLRAGAGTPGSNAARA